MRRQNKLLTLLLIVSLAMLTSIFTVNSAYCRDPPTPPNYSNIPIPPAPEWFSVTYVDRSYDFPTTTTYTTDYYTGKVNPEIYPGYHVENRTIELKIKNPNLQQFPREIDGNKSILEYAVQMKGAYGPDFIDNQGYTKYAAQKDSEYTIISLSVNSIAPGGKADIRIASAFGYEYMGADGIIPMMMEATKLSNWTQAKTITIPQEGSNQLATTAPEFPVIAIVPPLVATIVIVAVIQKRKRHQSNSK